jgi:hypothetical protein
MQHCKATFLLFAFVVCATISPARAQSGFRWSLQISAMGQKFDASGPGSPLLDAGWAPGGELQARLTPGRFSVGFGAQFSSLDQGVNGRIKVIGPFVEPRLVLVELKAVAAIYGSIRGGLIRFDYVDGPGWAQYINAGGGVLFKLGSRANLDIGATAGADDTGDPDFIVRAGLSFGLGSAR